LPGDAPLVFAPAALALLAAIADDGVPVAVGLLLSKALLKSSKHAKWTSWRSFSARPRGKYHHTYSQDTLDGRTQCRPCAGHSIRGGTMSRPGIRPHTQKRPRPCYY
jgi:hypothetical protein